MSDDPIEEPSESPLAPLSIRPDLEKTPLTYVSDYWLQVAEQAREHLVRLEGGGLGVIVSPGLAMASRTAGEAAMPLAAGQDQNQAQYPDPDADPLGDPDDDPDAGSDTPSTASDPDPRSLLGIDHDLDLAVFAVPEETRGADNRFDAEPVQAGSQIAAVTVTSAGGVQIVPGHLSSAARRETPFGYRTLDVAIAWPEQFGTAVIIDVDARLLGVAIETRDRRRVMTAAAAAAFVNRIRNDAVCQGIEVSDLTDAVRALLPVDAGVLVELVRPEAFSPEPSILPGDVLLRWQQTEVESAEQFADLYRLSTPGELMRYTVLRESRRLSGATVMPGDDCRPVAEPPHTLTALGVTLEWRTNRDTAGWTVATIIDGSPASTGGIIPGDQSGRRRSSTRDP